MAFYPVTRLRFVSSLKLTGFSLALLLVAALLTTACHRAITDPKDPNFIVADKGDDWKITRAELDAEIDNILKMHQATADQLGPEKMNILQTQMLDNMVLKKLILAKAATIQIVDADKKEESELERLKGPATDDQFQQKLKDANLTIDELKQRIHEKVLITEVLKAEAFKDVEPTEQEVDAIYLQNKDHFVTPPQVRASVIVALVDDKMTPEEKAAKKKKIDKAHARVVGGEDFSKVAMEVSEDKTSGPKGGDVDWFKRGQNEPGFDDVAFSTKQGAVSPVFETPMGYQFLKVTGLQPAGQIPTAEAREYISNQLRQMKMQQAQVSYSQQLLDNSGVTFHIVRVTPPSSSVPGGPPTQQAPSAQQPPPDQQPPAPPAESAPQPPPANGAPPQ